MKAINLEHDSIKPKALWQPCLIAIKKLVYCGWQIIKSMYIHHPSYLTNH